MKAARSHWASPSKRLTLTLTVRPRARSQLTLPPTVGPRRKEAAAATTTNLASQAMGVLETRSQRLSRRVASLVLPWSRLGKGAGAGSAVRLDERMTSNGETSETHVRGGCCDGMVLALIALI